MLFYPGTAKTREHHLQLTVEEALVLQNQLAVLLRQHLKTGGMTVGDKLRVVYTPATLEDGATPVDPSTPVGFVSFNISLVKEL